ncbi:MAG TPA: vWA domain-containing protein [Gemmataceae bacterium]
MHLAAAWSVGGMAVHGPLAPNQAIVYLLDASGSMGEWGKFDAARRALVATLRLQPPNVRYQVVVYAGTATVLLRGAPGECLPATPGNLTRTIAALEALPAPAGRSNHVEGLRTALTLHPELVLFFTDGDDLPALALRNVRKQAARPATVCLARVNGDRVEAPLEVK